jgi:hypothetical protein
LSEQSKDGHQQPGHGWHMTDTLAFHVRNRLTD